MLAAVHVPPPLPVSASRGRILIIDDEPLVRRAFARSLEAEHDVVLAASGEQSPRIVMTNRDFDVVLCDLMMPGMTGMNWYKWVSSHDRALASRVIFVTGGAVTQKARGSRPSRPRRRLQAVQAPQNPGRDRESQGDALPAS